MKRIVIVLLQLSIVGVVLGQSSQKGKVVLINTNNQPLALVEVSARGSNVTTSDAEGDFTLFFERDMYGQVVSFNSIYRAGYEVVNEIDLRIWIVSNDRYCKIVMCKKGYLDQERERYYNLGKGIYYTRYTEKASELKRLIAENKLTTERYQQEEEAAMAEYRSAMNKLNEYADKFARINSDELSGVDSIAMIKLRAGDIDGAIKTYDTSEILEKFEEMMDDRELIRGNIDDILPSLINQVRVYIRQGNDNSIERAENIIRTILEVKPDNPECLELLMKIKEYAKEVTIIVD